jgi:hypothetical protein
MSTFKILDPVMMMFKTHSLEPGIVVHTYNSLNWEAEAGGSRV